MIEIKMSLKVYLTIRMKLTKMMLVVKSGKP